MKSPVPSGRNRLSFPPWFWILAGMVLGMGVGLFYPQGDFWRNTLLPWIALPGNLFLALLQMVMLPLVVASVALGIASQGGQSGLGKLSVLSLGYFTSTTVVAITIGIGLALVLRPGDSIDHDLVQRELGSPRVTGTERTNNADATTKPSPDANAVPASPPHALANTPTLILDSFPKNPWRSFTEANMLTVVIFSILLGLALAQIPGGKEKPLVELLESIQAYTMVVVDWALLIAPIAVFGLMVQAMSVLGWDLLAGLFYYIATVLLGLGGMLLFYLAMVVVLGRIRPLYFIAKVREIQILAFSASSSAAVLPVSLRTAIEKLHVRAKTADFVLPLGATINMDGTAIYQGIATVFLAQVFGMELSPGQLLGLVATVTGASIGTAATPGVGIVILSGILTSVGIPLEGIALLFGVDRFLDMCRTSVNVTGDLVASKIIDRWVA